MKHGHTISPNKGSVMVIALIGRAGSGKSTIASKLAKELGLEIISSDMLRDYIDAKLPGFEQLDIHIKQGELPPADLVEKALLFKIKNCKEQVGFIVDNVQTYSQLFDKHLNIKHAFYLKLDESVADTRVKKRKREDLTLAFIQNRRHSFENSIASTLTYFGNRVVEINADTSPAQVVAQIKISLT